MDDQLAGDIAFAVFLVLSLAMLTIALWLADWCKC